MENETAVKLVRPKPHTELIKTTLGAIAQLKNEVELIRSRRNKINRAIGTARRVCKSVSPSIQSGKVYISMEVGGLDGFKDRALLRALEKMEGVTGITFDTAHDYPEYNCRDFSGRNDEFAIMLVARLKDAPKSCRKVIERVEREITERPIYKFVCD